MASPEERFPIETPRGAVTGAWASPPKAPACLVVAHGAGIGMDAPFMTGFSRALNDDGFATLRFNFPYMEERRKAPDTAGVLEAAWTATFDAAVKRMGAKPVFAGGKSLGGRIASMCVAEGMPAAGLVFLGYPLHPPGRPERVRDEHLYTIKAPMLFLEGTRDPFATPAILKPVLKKLGKRARLVAFDGADHSFRVKGPKRDDREIGASLAPATAAFMKEHS